MRDAHTLGLSLSIVVCSQYNGTPLMAAAHRGHTDIAIALLKAKADVNYKAAVRVRKGMPAHLDCLSV